MYPPNIHRVLPRQRDDHVYRTSAGIPLSADQTLVLQWPVGQQARDPSVRLEIQGLLDKDLLTLVSGWNLSEGVNSPTRHAVQNLGTSRIATGSFFTGFTGAD